jgi:hypothetical protein
MAELHHPASRIAHKLAVASHMLEELFTELRRYKHYVGSTMGRRYQECTLRTIIEEASRLVSRRRLER